jgi:hypothetical protein
MMIRASAESAKGYAETGSPEKGWREGGATPSGSALPRKFRGRAPGKRAALKKNLVVSGLTEKG